MYYTEILSDENSIPCINIIRGGGGPRTYIIEFERHISRRAMNTSQSAK